MISLRRDPSLSRGGGVRFVTRWGDSLSNRFRIGRTHLNVQEQRHGEGRWHGHDLFGGQTVEVDDDDHAAHLGLLLHQRSHLDQVQHFEQLLAGHTFRVPGRCGIRNHRCNAVRPTGDFNAWRKDILSGARSPYSPKSFDLYTSPGINLAAGWVLDRYWVWHVQPRGNEYF